MTLNNIIFIFVFIVSLSLFAFSVRRLISYLKIGKGERRNDQPAKRLKNTLLVAFGQSKLLREPFPGLIHFFIFWGFVILLTAIAESVGEGLYSGFSLVFLGSFYHLLTFAQEAIAICVVIAILGSLSWRIIGRPKRLEGHSTFDAYFILSLILVIMISMFGQNAAKMASQSSGVTPYRFISSLVVPAFGSMQPASVSAWYYLLWWIHIGCVLLFLNYLPYSKHLHILSSIPNVYLSRLTPYGALNPIDLSDENLTKFGASDVEDFTWKQLLDGYTCTECGRCHAACPAQTTGKPLSPRKIVLDIRHRLMEKAPLILKNVQASEKKLENGSYREQNPLQRQLVDDFISEDELWACTTCMACMKECPVMIEHVDSIVDMRRYLVLNESRFPKELKITFQNLERNYNPWPFGHASRMDWAEGIDIPLIGQNKDADFLFWVGCAGSFDDRVKKVTRDFVKILKAAHVNFAVLGVEEKCTGDAARRAGNEYLAQTLMTENIETLNNYRVKKIVTACPHCFNALKNEYPQFGGTYEVIHHSDLILQLLRDGKIMLSEKMQAKVSYHDSCYLGRYNEIFEQPRMILGMVPGLKMIEMKRSRDKGFCCGAGGARMFMEETIGKRINHERTEEALSLKPDMITTACPFCLTMLSDGVKDKEMAEKVKVKDVAELIAESLFEG